MRLLITALDFQFMLTEKSYIGLDELKKLTRGMLAFCGEDQLVDPVRNDIVKEGERIKLKVHLEKIKFLANQIVQQISENSKQRKKIE